MLLDDAVGIGHKEMIPFTVDLAMNPMGFLIKDSNMIGFLNVSNTKDFSILYVFYNRFIDIEFEIASRLMGLQPLSFLLFNFLMDNY